MGVTAGRARDLKPSDSGDSGDTGVSRLVAHAFGPLVLLRPFAPSTDGQNDARIEACNNEALQLLRPPPGDPIGKAVSEVFGREAIEALAACLRVVEGADPVHEFEWLVKAGLSVQVRAIRCGDDLVALALKESTEYRFGALGPRQLLDHAPFSVVVKTPDSRYLYANKEFERQVGMRADQILGRTSLEILPAAIAERFTARDRMVSMTRAPVTFESEELLDGRRLTFINRAYPVLDGAGDVSVIVSIETDVTALRDAERKVSQSERLFRAVFETAAVGIAIYGAKDRRLVSCNPTYATMLGYTPEEIAGVSFIELTYGEDRGRQLELSDLQESGTIDTFEIEKRYIRKDGNNVWGRASVSLVRDEDGAPLYTVAMLTDLSESHAAQERLRQSEHQLRLITDSVPVLITYCDADSRYRFVNREYEEWSGKARTEIIGKTVRENLGEANYAKVKPFIEAVLTGCPQHFETEISFPKAGTRAISCSYVPHLDEIGAIVGYFVVVSDISTRMEQERLLRKAKEEAEEISRAKSSFLATMSHELRTPLNAIIGFSEMIREEVLGPLGTSRYRDYASDIHLSGEHLLDLINSILDLARIEAGRFEIDQVPTDLVAVANGALPIMRGPAEAGALNLVFDLPDRPALVLGDPVRLRQVLINLLSNAIKFTPAKGTVRLSVVRRDDDMIALTVCDTGIGMKEEDIPKALELFGQIDNRMARRYEGTGIGLPFTKALVEAQGGRLSIKSAPEQGTTVVALFPVLNESLTEERYFR